MSAACTARAFDRVGAPHRLQHLGLLGGRALLDQLDGEIDVAGLARVQVGLVRGARAQRRSPRRAGAPSTATWARRARRPARIARRASVPPGRPSERGRGRSAAPPPAPPPARSSSTPERRSRRQAQQERELLCDRILRADHPVLEDAAVKLRDDLLACPCAAGLDQQGGGLAQRDRAARIAAQVLDHASARPARRRRRPCRSGSRAAARPSPAAPAPDPRAARAGPRAGDRRRPPRPSAPPCRRRRCRPAPRRVRVLRVAPPQREQRRDERADQQRQDGEHDREPHRKAARARRLGRRRRRLRAAASGSAGAACGCCICGIGG